MLVAIYVDDIVVAYCDLSTFKSFKDELTNRFKCKDLGTLTRVLNMEVTRTTDGGIFLSQSSFIRDVLERFREFVPAAANPVQLPADPKLR